MNERKKITRTKPPKENHSTKFNRLVDQAFAAHPYKNQSLHRYLWIRMELTTKPTPAEQIEIDQVLEQMATLSSCMGLDSTPDERYEYRLKCARLMLRIKMIHEEFYWDIQIQSDYGV